jgi:glutamyl-tRNA synthetase
MLDDLIIIRSDGTPTYNFTVVVDDVDMNITHVIRGDDHLNNTPKQIHIYNAFGYKLPFFAHLPMILGSDRTRLSKRHGATSVLSYREMGYLSEALVNYLVRLGWSYGDQEIFTREELIKYFSFDNVGKSSAVFNPEKLLWLNSQYMMNSKNEELAKLVIPFLQKEGIIDEQKPLNWEWLSKLIGILKERNKTLVSLAQSMKVYIMDEFEYDEKAKNKFLNKNNLDNLIEVYESLKTLDKFVSPEIEKIFHDLSTRKNIKLSMIAQPVRVSVTGKAESPGIYDVLEILGKEKSLRRIERAISLIRGY